MVFVLNVSEYIEQNLGVTLVLNLKSLDFPGETYGPLNVTVNNTKIVGLWDPQDEDDYYTVSWAIPPNLYDDTLTITLTLDVTATTSIAIRQVTCAVFQIFSQTQTLWCWLATAASVAIFYDPSSPWTQCKLANQLLNQNDCCTDGGSSECNQAGNVANALGPNGTNNLASQQANTIPPLSIQAQTNANQPVGIRIAWPGGSSAHIIVATGVSEDLTTVLVVDPIEEEGTSYVPWSTLVNNYLGAGGTWTNTFLTQS
jgi:hypothetical protein